MECWAGLLGSVAPCVLYGSNVERLGSSPGTFANHCLPYTGLYLMGNTFFGWNCLAPWFSYPIRTAIRRKFNLEVTNLIIVYFSNYDMNLLQVCDECHSSANFSLAKNFLCYYMEIFTLLYFLGVN